MGLVLAGEALERMELLLSATESVFFRILLQAPIGEIQSGSLLPDLCRNSFDCK